MACAKTIENQNYNIFFYKFINSRYILVTSNYTRKREDWMVSK